MIIHITEEHIRKTRHTWKPWEKTNPVITAITRQYKPVQIRHDHKPRLHYPDTGGETEIPYWLTKIIIRWEMGYDMEPFSINIPEDNGKPLRRPTPIHIQHIVGHCPIEGRPILDSGKPGATPSDGYTEWEHSWV